ncbi:MAG: hypothetical protein ACWGOL_02840 [Desulfuromonadales bacterium]
MIYIGATTNNGSAIYFDVYAEESQKRGRRVSGLIGDGCYEGEVLVETGCDDCVTFADAWLGGSGFAEFLSRCGADQLERALLDTVREMPYRLVQRGKPHRNGKADARSHVAETSLQWHCSA